MDNGIMMLQIHETESSFLRDFALDKLSPQKELPDGGTWKVSWGARQTMRSAICQCLLSY